VIAATVPLTPVRLSDDIATLDVVSGGRYANRICRISVQNGALGEPKQGSDAD
jgi:hypothetical protein